MAHEVSGTVSRTYEREWKGKRGTTLLHSFQLNDDRTYYRTGEEKLANEGDSVVFEYEEDRNGNAQVLADTFETREKPKSEKAPSPKGRTTRETTPTKSTSTSSPGAVKEAYWDAKAKREVEVVEPRITVASAQSDAVALVAAALAADLLQFGNANKGAKLSMLLDYVDQVTKRFAVTRWNAAAVLADAVAEVADAPVVEESEEDEEIN